MGFMPSSMVVLPQVRRLALGFGGRRGNLCSAATDTGSAYITNVDGTVHYADEALSSPFFVWKCN
ncbi:hypothetical protein J6590_030542 [Homalodisca vitripennis]|nr:hypothetical protein J6590_030542 [Homalodisca vitripennis]